MEDRESWRRRVLEAVDNGESLTEILSDPSDDPIGSAPAMLDDKASRFGFSRGDDGEDREADEGAQGERQGRASLLDERDEAMVTPEFEDARTYAFRLLAIG